MVFEYLIFPGRGSSTGSNPFQASRQNSSTGGSPGSGQQYIWTPLGQKSGTAAPGSSQKYYKKSLHRSDDSIDSGGAYGLGSSGEDTDDFRNPEDAGPHSLLYQNLNSFSGRKRRFFLISLCVFLFLIQMSSRKNQIETKFSIIEDFRTLATSLFSPIGSAANIDFVSYHRDNGLNSITAFVPGLSHIEQMEKQQTALIKRGKSCSGSSGILENSKGNSQGGGPGPLKELDVHYERQEDEDIEYSVLTKNSIPSVKSDSKVISQDEQHGHSHLPVRDYTGPIHSGEWKVHIAMIFARNAPILAQIAHLKYRLGQQYDCSDEYETYGDYINEEDSEPSSGEKGKRRKLQESKSSSEKRNLEESKASSESIKSAEKGSDSPPQVTQQQGQSSQGQQSQNSGGGGEQHTNGERHTSELHSRLTIFNIPKTPEPTKKARVTFSKFTFYLHPNCGTQCYDDLNWIQTNQSAYSDVVYMPNFDIKKDVVQLKHKMTELDMYREIFEHLHPKGNSYADQERRKRFDHDYLVIGNEKTYFYIGNILQKFCKMAKIGITERKPGFYGGFLMKTFPMGHRFVSTEAGITFTRKVFENCQHVIDTCPNENPEWALAYCFDKCVGKSENAKNGNQKTEKLSLRPSHIEGFYPDTPEQMLHWFLWPISNHLPGWKLSDAPLSHHFIKPYRIPLMEMDSVNMRGEGRKIPKRIHQIWVGNITKAPLNEMLSCSEIHPDFEYYFWTEDAMAKIQWDSHWAANGPMTIKSGFTPPSRINPATGKRYDNFELLNLPDMIRIEVLYRFGGIAIDGDSICTRNHAQLFKDLTNGGYEYAVGFENEKHV